MSRDALVVGINAYQSLPGLNAPARDAEAIAQRLQTYGEFRVHRLPEIIYADKPQIGTKTQVKLRELETALVNMFKPKGGHIPQTALFYFSGHGIQKEAGIQEGYLAVSDSQPEMGFYGLSLFWLRRLLQESPVRQRIIWLDCCHSGELLNFLEADPGAHAGTDRLFMAASRPHESAYESLDSPYSVFTQALLQGLDPGQQESGVVTNHSLTAWVSQSLNGEIQQPLFESSGSEIVLTRGVKSVAQQKRLPASDICPYRGLEFFDEAHAEYFFGRENLTDQLIGKLRTGQFVAVVGASGSGKSSLVRAGLLWELRQGQKFSGSDRWRIKLLTPTERPLKSLAAAFIDPDVTELERAEQLRRAELFLKDGGIGLAQLVRACLPVASSLTTGLQPKARPQMLLVIDQFEEVFTLGQGPQAEQERQQFFNCLLGALRAAEDCLKLVVILRADFFGKCSLYDDLAQQIEQNLVMVTPLNYEQIKATIIRPAQKVGLVCEPNLVYTMLLDVIGAPGELPLLQYTLLELWQRRQNDPAGGAPRLTLDTYTELGGVRGTLQKRATEIFYSLTVAEQAVAKRIFLALTQLGEGTEDTRRRVVKSELVSPAFPIALVEGALEKLVAAKLVVTNQERGGLEAGEAGRRSSISDLSNLRAEKATATPPTSTLMSHLPSQLQSQETIDVAHEALIRNWSLLRNWLDENREMLQRQRRIERAAQEWDAANQPSGLEYLLRGGRLMDAEDFVTTFPRELSALAQQYIAVSQEESQRAKRESRLLQISVPSALLIALAMTFNQYHSAVQTQAEKDYQLQVATSRERAAIAQSILQEPNNDPMTALLISRLAAEQGGSTYEAQSSLRAALRSLRLQLELQGHQGAVHQIVFSPDQRYLATSSADGTVRLWSLDNRTIYTTSLQPMRVLSWSPASSQTPDDLAADITVLAVSPNGEQVAAIAQGTSQVKVWAAASGALLFTLELPHAANRIMFSPNGKQIVTTSIDHTISIWRADSGRLQATLPRTGVLNSIRFSPNGQFLLSASADGDARLWSIFPESTSAFTPKLVRSFQHAAALNSATFSPSGRWLATACNDGKARIWDVATGKLSQTFPKGQSILSRATPASPSTPMPFGSEAATPSVNGSQPVTQVLFSPNEQFLAVTDLNQRIWLWEVTSGQLGVKLIAQDRPAPLGGGIGVDPIAFSPDSRLLVTANPSKENSDGFYAAYLWDIQTGQEVGTLQGHGGTIEAAQFSPDGAYVATASMDGGVRLWSAERGGELPTVAMLNVPVRWALFVNRPGSVAATANPTESKGQPFDLGNRFMPHETETSSASVAIANMMTVATNGTFQHWQIWSDAMPTFGSIQNQTEDTVSPINNRQIKSQNVWQQLLSGLPRLFHPWRPDSRGLSAAASSENQPALVPEADVNQVLTPAGAIASAKTPLTAFTLSQDGQLIATATADGWVEIRQKRDNQPSQRVHRFQNIQVDSPELTPGEAAGRSAAETITPVRQLVFSPDGQRLMGISDDLTVRLWDVSSGQLSQILQGHHASIEDAQFSPDGQWIVTASWDKTARIWRTNSGRMVRVLSYSDGISSATFSPDNQRVAITSWDGNASIADVTTGLVQVILTGHRGAVLSSQFSPDGRSLVTAGADGTARLWDAETGIEQAQLRPRSADNTPVSIRRAFFSPDGQYIATLTEDGQVHLWAATWEMLLKLARDRSLRQLTPEECIRYLRVVPHNCPKLQ